MTQEARHEKINQIKKASKNINMKHAFSQTVISFNS
jgi:hypothetical protein